MTNTQKLLLVGMWLCSIGIAIIVTRLYTAKQVSPSYYYHLEGDKIVAYPTDSFHIEHNK